MNEALEEARGEMLVVRYALDHGDLYQAVERLADIVNDLIREAERKEEETQSGLGTKE